jgi:hypothetical protein
MALDNLGGVGVSILSAEQVTALADEQFEGMEDTQEVIDYDPLASYIMSEFQFNKDARVTSEIEDDIVDSLRAYNGKYSKEDIARIAISGGSQIFMNITATKARAARSWIADILKPPQGEPWSIEPTPVEDLPTDLRTMLTEALQKEFEESLQQAQPQPQEGAEGQPQPQQAPNVEQAQETLREANQRKRDIEKAVAEEITREAKYQLVGMEKKIRDQLKEGNWDSALSDFLDDFVIYPAAFIKGPIISKSKKLVWKDGEAVFEDIFSYKNKRVNPLDIYPSPEASCINEGNLCEHMRLTLAELESLRGVEGYVESALIEAIEDYELGVGASWVDTGIEQDIAEEENRGTFIDMDRNVIHALHFWGNIPLRKLREWEFFEKIEGLEKSEDTDIIAIEAILVGNKVIKCVVNDDPMLRRPYYKASFMNVPGAFWGKSLPMLMASIQRMCNAVARALSNNLGIASGPQIELYTDRLADDGPVEEIVPFKIWQLKSDPTGAGGRAINFWQPTSNAQELLAVYQSFEDKADDVTGIPKYAYGNERTAGAAQTAQGLAMLLESTSKIIKDCIRNIDEGLIKPRIMYQFHHNMLNMDEFKYSGDINVATIGSRTLSIRGAEATKRNEFLQATANPTDMEVMGIEGRAAILRKMGEDLGLPNVIPTDFELKQKIKKQQEQQAAAEQAMAQAEEAKATAGIEATTVQIEGQKAMHLATMQKEMAALQVRMKEHQEEMQLKVAEIQRKMKADSDKATISAIQEKGKTDRQTQEVALSINKGEGI